MVPYLVNRSGRVQLIFSRLMSTFPALLREEAGEGKGLEKLETFSSFGTVKLDQKWEFE